MRIARAIGADALDPFYILIEGENYIRIQDPFLNGGLLRMEESGSLSSVRLLSPSRPSKIVCVGVNYRDHASEMAHDLPKEPLIFLKPPSAVIGHKDSIIYPKAVRQLDYEAELAVVIGKLARNVSEKEAEDYILGFTCLNDVTARDLQAGDGQWTRCKGFDSFCPIGPWIETDLDWRNATITARLNGETRQSGNTSQMIFDIRRIVSYVSSVMTLLPGDVLATGTPGGIGPMQVGDCIEIEISGIGTLKNRVG